MANRTPKTMPTIGPVSSVDLATSERGDSDDDAIVMSPRRAKKKR